MNAIPVARVRFNNQSQEGPGISSSSMRSCWDPDGGKNSRHKIWIHPWMRCWYWVEFYDRNPMDDNAQLVKGGYVVPNPGDHVITVDGPVAPPQRGPGRPPKGGA